MLCPLSSEASAGLRQGPGRPVAAWAGIRAQTSTGHVAMSFPDGYLLEDLIIFPDVASRGYELLLPDLREARPEVLNEFSDLWQNWLLQLPKGIRLSFQSDCNADFNAPMDKYARDTSTTSNAWSRRVREERHARCLAQIRAGQMVR